LPFPVGRERRREKERERERERERKRGRERETERELCLFFETPFLHYKTVKKSKSRLYKVGNDEENKKQ
jgi:hypothetical protein